jgi:hypothetical protein
MRALVTALKRFALNIKLLTLATGRSTSRLTSHA